MRGEAQMMRRCDHHWDPARCDATGRYWLYAPDGRLTPGGPLCLRHAVEVVREHREKLAEQWQLRAVGSAGPEPWLKRGGARNGHRAR